MSTLDDAKELQASCEALEGDNREQARIDNKFRIGEQWDEPWMHHADRVNQKAPIITVNQLPQYVNQVINDIKQNRPSHKARPVDDKADVDLADIYAGIMRHAQYQGKAEMARDIAAEHAVTAGLGWYRVVTDYVDPASFDQEPIWLGIDEPQNVYHNDFRAPDGSDLSAVLIVSSVAEGEYKRQYPKAAQVSWSGSEPTADDTSIDIAEFYSLTYRDDVLLQLADGTLILESEAKKQIASGMPLAAPTPRERKTRVPYVYWCKMNGVEELESRDIELPHIPVFPVIGACMRIDGKPHRFGLIRAARDPQRYFNWLKSAGAEYLQNAPKSPWVAPGQAVAAYEEYWKNANTINYGYLPYAHVDNNGNPLPAPQRQMPAPIPSGLVQAEQGATDDIKKSLGMYSAAIGARGNATSGVQERAQQQESDVGTFHYSDNLAKTVLHEGKVLLAWIPKLYGERQVARIIGIDEEPHTVKLTKMLPQAVTKVRTSKGVEKVYNLGVGKYDLAVSVGPSYTTRRQEASQMMTEAMRADPTLSQKAGDIIFANFDIPGADALVKRLKLYNPPQIQQAEADESDDQNSPEALQMAAQQVQQGQQQLQQRAQMLAEIEEKMKERGDQVAGEEARLVQLRTQMAAEKQVLESRAREIESQLEVNALRQAEKLRKLSEGLQPQSVDTGSGELAEIERARENLRRDMVEAELRMQLKQEHSAQALRALMPAEDKESVQGSVDEGGAEMAARQELAPAAVGPDAPQPSAPSVDLSGIHAVLEQLINRPVFDPADVRRMIKSESERMQKALTKAIADSRTTNVTPTYDDDGNIVGGSIQSADGKVRKVKLSDKESA